ncbi:GTP cyclohydrolase I FolE [Candidatus Poribacteria bacterium]|mgnify:FL=1|jgi:GTP cyclohydrolase I|nr:GTP cyclohydrolase I FolE [Candidatus Poribacteria bacterium]|tara:strand:- start:207 stop:794 length:588 start_codon:yes stop_codon:yes gene_type:complete
MKQYDLDDDLFQGNNKLERLYHGVIEEIGEDPTRQGLLKTPYRSAKALQFLTQGYTQKVDEIVNGAIFDEEFDDMVIVKDIEFYSLCEHHILPFFGKCHVGYIPNKRIVGLSKVPRVIDMFARRLQVQERLTHQIAQAINEVLQPQGIAVVMEAQHMCMMIRGVEKERSSTFTNVMLGTFREEDSTRAEFFHSIK